MIDGCRLFEPLGLDLHALAETALELGKLDLCIAFRVTGVLSLIERIRRGEGQRRERLELARWSGDCARLNGDRGATPHFGDGPHANDLSYFQTAASTRGNHSRTRR